MKLRKDNGNSIMQPSSTSNIQLLGIPFDEYSSFLKGSAQGPKKIHDLLQFGSANGSTELGVDSKGNQRIKPFQMMRLEGAEHPFHSIEEQIKDLAFQGNKPLIFGGDHSITYPILKGLNAIYKDITILHFDAHPDLYHEFKGNPLSHACPFARIMENDLATRLVQIGIRTLNQHQREQAEKFGVEIHEMRTWQDDTEIKLQGPVYISVDLDALDPAFAPGVSHLEPGGMSVRQVIRIIQSINAPIIGADIVEYNPIRDVNDMTGMVAIKLYKEICGKMLIN